jgi:hypothetical protein
MTAVIEELVDATALRAEATPVLFHGGIRLDLGQLTCVQSGDLLHGYDITRTAGAPWPIDPRRAGAPWLHSQPAHHQPRNQLRLHRHLSPQPRCGGAVTARFTNGTLDMQPEPTGSDRPNTPITRANPIAHG